MLNYKKRGFSNFSLQRKIIVLFLLLTILLSAIFSVAAFRAGIGLTFWTFFPSAYLLVLAAVTYHLHNLKKILKKAYRPVAGFFYACMILFFFVFTVFSFLILGYESDDIPENPDLVIVLGCQVYGYTPSTALKSRLDTAAKVLNKYPDIICVVAGGQGPDETVPEAAVMKKYLVDKGIDESRIFEEAGSSTSFENLKFTKKIIEDNNLKHEDIIIVTNEYHIPRSIMIAKRIYQDSQIYAVKANSPFTTVFPFFNAGVVREFFAFVKSYIFDRV